MKLRRLVSILLALCMIIGLIPMTAFADDATDEGTATIRTSKYVAGTMLTRTESTPFGVTMTFPYIQFDADLYENVYFFAVMKGDDPTEDPTNKTMVTAVPAGIENTFRVSENNSDDDTGFWTAELNYPEGYIYWDTDPGIMNYFRPDFDYYAYTWTDTSLTKHAESAPSYDAETGTYINGNITYYTDDQGNCYLYDSDLDTYVEADPSETIVTYFTFASNGDFAQVTGLNSDDTEIIIPDYVPGNYPDESLRGRTVTAVDIEAMRYKNIVSVTMGDYIDTIRLGAFADCTSLEEVIVGSGLQTIGEAAFNSCSSLTKFQTTSMNQVNIESNGRDLDPFRFTNEALKLYCPHRAPIRKTFEDGWQCHNTGHVFISGHNLIVPQHEYQRYIWDLSDTANPQCLFRFKCDVYNDAMCFYEETIPADSVTWESTDCTQPGTITYTATLSYDLDEDGTPETYTAQTEQTTQAGTHSFGTPVWDWAEDHSTCRAAFKCEICGTDSILDAEVTTSETPATHEESGVKTYTATVTGEDGVEYTDTYSETIPIIEHDYRKCEAAVPTYDAETGTYTNGNIEHYTCSGCDKYFTYDNETGTYTETTAANVSVPYFRIDDNGIYVRIMGYNGTDSEIIVPDTVPDNYPNEAIRGKTINSINQSAFKDNTTITKVVMGDKIKHIGWEAFRRALNLEEIFIGSGISQFDSDVFFECPSLRKFTCTKTTGSVKLSAYTIDKELLSNVTFYGMHSGSFRDCTGFTFFTQSSPPPMHYIGLDAHKGVTWNWSEDLGSATATFDPCTDCDYSGELEATVSYEVTTPPTASTDGVGTYTAVAVDENGNEYTDTKTVSIPAAGEPKFETLSLVLSGKIGVNFFMNLPQLEGVDYSDSYMEFTVDGKGGATTTDAFDENFMNDTNKFYGFTCYISSIQMADTITAVFHYGDGQTVQTTYSVRDYLENFEGYAANYDDTTVALIRALGDYGHYVQLFLSDERGWTIGVDHAEMDCYYTGDFDLEALKYATAQYAARKDGTDNAIKKISVSLVLDSGTDIRVHFKPASDCNLSASVDNVSYEDIELSGGRFLVEITDIAAHDLGTPHIIEAVTDSGRTRLQLSALSYVNAILSGSSDGNALNAAAAIYNYYMAAQAYKNTH